MKKGNEKNVGATISRPHFEEKTQTGITLIALIITIIVMLILVGVSVNVALNGGLFDTAKTAVSETQLASDKEILQSAILGSINKDLKVENSETLKNNLPEEWTVVAANAGTYTVTSSKENEFTVYEDGKIVEGTLNQYGFYYNKEYICSDFTFKGNDFKATITILEDGTIVLLTYQEIVASEGDKLYLHDFAGVKVLTVENLEFNKEYTATGTLNCQCTYIVNDNGNLSSKQIISKDQVTYSEKLINIGGLMEWSASDDGLSIDANGEIFTAEN